MKKVHTKYESDLGWLAIGVSTDGQDYVFIIWNPRSRIQGWGLGIKSRPLPASFEELTRRILASLNANATQWHHVILADLMLICEALPV